MLDVALEDDIIEKSGSYFSFEGERLGQGRANVRAFLDEHPDILATICRRIEEKEGVQITGGPTGQAAEAPIAAEVVEAAAAEAEADEAVAAEG